MNLVLIGVLIYVALQLLIGILVSRRIANEEDYLLAGRQLGYGLATFSIFATWFGAETCIGAAGSIYENGLAGARAEPFGYGICLLLMGAVFAAPLWRRKLTTLADLFRTRYSSGVERLAVLMIAPASLLWAAAQIRAFGQVLDATGGVGTDLAITVAAGVAVIYTVFGGLKADVVTDLIQGVVIIAGLVILLGAVLWGGGEGGFAWRNLEPEQLRWTSGERNWLESIELWAIPICGSVIAQELVMRVLATRSPRVAQRAALMGGGLYLLIGLIPVFIGLAGASMMPGLEDPEQILPLMARRHLSTFFYIVFAGALLSAILSTVDSTLLAASSLVSHNIIVPMRPGLSEAAKVRIARVTVVVFGIIAYVLALHAGSIYELVESASAFGSAGVFVVAVFGLFTNFGGVRSAFAALIAGMGVWVGGNYIFELPYSFISSLGAAFGVYALFGWLEKFSRGGGEKAALSGASALNL